MKNLAVRLHEKNKLSLDSFELPKIRENEILACVVTDSLCMSTYKALIQGKEHKRVPDNIDTKPVIVGHEFCGEILEVGAVWQEKYRVGDKFVIQPALNYKGSLEAPGYSYQYIGGDSQYIVIPSEAMETDNLITYNSNCFYHGSLTEPMSCIIGAFNSSYHTKCGEYEHVMGTKPGGKMLILAGCGPMGIGAIDYALNGLEAPPSLLVVTDKDNDRINNAKLIFTDKHVTFLNDSDKNALMELSGKEGYDDVFVFAPVPELIELGGELLANDGCLNFFAGPTNKDFTAKFNFYNVHYAKTHIVGTSGGNAHDMKMAIELMEKCKINPSVMITHIGGLDSVVDATMNLPKIPGAKKLIYTDISLPLTKITDFCKLAYLDNENANLFKGLSEICKENGDIWCSAAEEYLLKNAKRISAE